MGKKRKGERKGPSLLSFFSFVINMQIRGVCAAARPVTKRGREEFVTASSPAIDPPFLLLLNPTRLLQLLSTALERRNQLGFMENTRVLAVEKVSYESVS